MNVFKELVADEVESLIEETDQCRDLIPEDELEEIEVIAKENVIKQAQEREDKEVLREAGE